MVDTIVLRLHGVRKYRSILKNLDPLNTKGHTTSMGRITVDEMQQLGQQGINDPGQIMHILRMNRTGKFLVRTKHAKHVNTSGHYEFAYMVEHNRDFIEFNFSVPKYVYGSNVLMFLDHPGDRDYTYHFCTEIDHNIERAYDKLRGFLHEFFKMEFLGVEIDPRDVEVNRIDVCFNHVFPSRSEARRYPEYQKHKVKKHARAGNDGYKEYDTSLMYVTKLYSAKIYHKGTEYAKNDSKEHKRFNKEKGYQHFNIPRYQAFGDRMLRYELTMRTGMLNYLHKHNLFRSNCPLWQRDFAIYSEVEAKNQRIERLAKKIGSLPEEEKEAFREANSYEKITRDEWQIHKYVMKVINKRTYFTFEVDEEHAVYNRQVVADDSHRALFSPKQLQLCLNKLVEFIQEYQMKELPGESKVEAAIDAYNLPHKKKLPKGEMLDFYQYLLKCGSFKEAAKLRYDHRATMYRYKERFKKIGITDNNLIPLTSEGIPGAPLDLRAYHSEHQFNPYFLNKKGYLDLL